MPKPDRWPNFLPLTIDATTTVSTTEDVRRRAVDAEAAAADCWAALLAGCDAPGCRALPTKLRELLAATSVYAGTQWWFGSGSQHRHRVDRALARIEDAVAERDGADFAEAFVGYDQAVATALVNAHSRLESQAT